MRLIHTSDLHNGSMHHIPHVERLECTLELAHRERADVIILAGDVFDHTQIAPEILDECATLLGSSSIPSVILPGNHDCLIDGQYMRGHFDNMDSVHVMGYPGQMNVLRMDDLDVAFWGIPHRDYEPLQPFMDIPSAIDGVRFKIGIGHGHLVRRQQDLSDWYRFELSQLQDHPFHYVALGHWDRFYEVSEELAIYYSGAPHYANTINLVELADDGRIKVTRIPVEVA